MGEYADYMLNGDDCQVCGMHIGSGDGFPRTCAGCGGDDCNDGAKKRMHVKSNKARLKRIRYRANKRARLALLKTQGESKK